MASSARRVRKFTTAYALGMVLYPDQKDQAAAMVGAASGFGVCLGPVVGSIVYELTGFMGPFLLSATANGLQAYMV